MSPPDTTKTLTKDQILNANDLRIEQVLIPGWGYLHLRTMSGQERAELEALEAKDTDSATLMARTLVYCICDSKGQLLLTMGDVAALRKKSSLCLHRAFKAACELNAIEQEDVEDAAKNSAAGRSDDSTSD